jgi:hypothetical protein
MGIERGLDQMATKDISDWQVLHAYRQYEEHPHLPGTNPMVEFSYHVAESHGDKLVEKWPYDYLMELTGQPPKVCYRAIERAARRGFVDYGVSLRTGWATTKGKELYFSQCASPIHP